MRWLALLLGLLIVVSPNISFEPATLNVKVKLDPAPSNRLLVWMLIGEDFATKSERSLNGDDGIKTFFLPQWKDVPSGEYEARAIVYDSGGKVVAQATQRVLIASRQHE